jgi:plasmid stabilization system protein ParE
VTYRIIFTPRARADAMNAFRWIEERSPTAAARWYAGLRRAVAKLAKMPERHPIAEESEQLGLNLRQMLYGRRRGVYRILFSIEGDTVYLHFIRHSAQGTIEP